MRLTIVLLAALALLACGGNDGQGNEQPAPPPGKLWYTTRSVCGKYRCEVARVSVEPAGGETGTTRVTIDLRFPDLSDRLLLDERIRISRVVALDGQNYAAPLSFVDLPRIGDLVQIPQLEIGGERERIALIQLEGTVAIVLDSKEYVQGGIDLGPNEMLHCGPFELVATGAPERVSVLAGAFEENQEEHSEYHFKVRPGFTHHRWALGAVRLTDAKGRRLVGVGSGGFEDRSTGEYALPSAADGTHPAIEYPVTLKIRVPQKIRDDRVVFQILDLPVADFEMPE